MRLDPDGLLSLRDCTPMTRQSKAAMTRLLRISEENLAAFAAGAPRNVVS